MTEVENLIAALISAKKTVATAESCTGGMLGKLLTDVPGSSAAYPGGVISYSNSVKEALLGVDAEVLSQYGAVSEPVARQMAEGVRVAIGADFGIGITGIAGPSSDGTTKPVGLVYVALAVESATICEELHLSGSRPEIREAACLRALRLLEQALRQEGD